MRSSPTMFKSAPITHYPVQTRLYSEQTFYKAFVQDIKHSTQSIVIESPYITQRRFKSLLPHLSAARKRGVHIIVNTRNPLEHDAQYIDSAFNAVLAMQQIGIKVLYTVRLHRKLAIIDKQYTWEGSLNILSQNDSSEIMRRTDSLDQAKQLSRFIGIRV